MPIPGNIRGPNGPQLSFDHVCRHGAASLALIIAGRWGTAIRHPGPDAAALSGIYGRYKPRGMLRPTGTPNPRQRRQFVGQGAWREREDMSRSATTTAYRKTRGTSPKTATPTAPKKSKRTAAKKANSTAPKKAFGECSLMVKAFPPSCLPSQAHPGLRPL